MFRKQVIAVAAVGLAAVLAAGSPAAAGHRDCSSLHALNPDRDGTLDWHEVRRAAKRLFYKLNNDGDTTLELDELRGRVGIISFARANPDRDGSLDMREWLKLVKHRFHRANPDGDGTVDCREWNTLRGKRLQRVTY